MGIGWPSTGPVIGTYCSRPQLFLNPSTTRWIGINGVLSTCLSDVVSLDAEVFPCDQVAGVVDGSGFVIGGSMEAAPVGGVLGVEVAGELIPDEWPTGWESIGTEQSIDSNAFCNFSSSDGVFMTVVVV